MAGENPWETTDLFIYLVEMYCNCKLCVCVCVCVCRIWVLSKAAVWSFEKKVDWSRRDHLPKEEPAVTMVTEEAR